MGKGTIRTLDELSTYSPPGHSGTVNRRLVTADEGRTFELIHGRMAPDGAAERHAHATQYQAIYVLAGRARAVLGDDAPVDCGPGSIIGIPPGVEHEIRSLGPGPLDMLIVYAPPAGAPGRQ